MEYIRQTQKMLPRFFLGGADDKIVFFPHERGGEKTEKNIHYRWHTQGYDEKTTTKQKGAITLRSIQTPHQPPAESNCVFVLHPSSTHTTEKDGRHESAHLSLDNEVSRICRPAFTSLAKHKGLRGAQDRVQLLGSE